MFKLRSGISADQFGSVLYSLWHSQAVMYTCHPIVDLAVTLLLKATLKTPLMMMMMMMMMIEDMVFSPAVYN